MKNRYKDIFIEVSYTPNFVNALLLSVNVADQLLLTNR
ncbi:hypothetical protein FHW36_104249 [Chitinophaga polysaccharea]|uniref:Uncharacterized protein n=1 Tax=Chitinophaga polysaccharea TaxID=1293035 RepID=A0A561PR19_9BACT|nr:hypothetical protein FHW36_104249 [Chitinophaga polysaccharea]